jgi:hypothetical protein
MIDSFNREIWDGAPREVEWSIASFNGVPVTMHRH